MLLNSRNIILLILTFTYSMSMSGLSIKAHYCHGKLVSISINAQDKKCCFGKKKMPPKCCDTKKALVKIETKHLKASFEQIFQAPVDFVVFSSNAVSNIFHPFTSFFSNRIFLQRWQIPLPDIFLFIRVFRI